MVNFEQAVYTATLLRVTMHSKIKKLKFFREICYSDCRISDLLYPYCVLMSTLMRSTLMRSYMIKIAQGFWFLGDSLYLTMHMNAK